MRVLKLRSVDVVKLAVVVALIYLLISFIVFLFLFLIGGAFFSSSIKSFLPFAGLGFLLVILGPIFYAFIAFIFTLIAGLLLNFSLSISGGLPLKFEE